MRLHILSDLHLEFEPFTPPAVEADVVILAGDVGTGRNGLKWALKTFPDRPVIYVLGNHEFYGQKLQKLIKELQELADGTNISLLENEQCSIGEVVFLGATLWTDFGLNGNPVVSEVVAQTGMNDYRRIRTLPRYSRLRPSDTRRLHIQSRQWLEDRVLSLKGRKVVVVTHHAPSRESIPPAFDGDGGNGSATVRRPGRPAAEGGVAPLGRTLGRNSYWLWSVWIHQTPHDPSWKSLLDLLPEAGRPETHP